jgi:ATP-binding cassette subfamily F protein 3
LRVYAAKDRELEQRNYLGRFGFSGERIFEPVAPFSGGEKARLVLALIIRQQPNLLLLDEPTNHLDLEMRQALSVALIEYSGALVVISHDRHLLRSVCDELLIVHDGIVDRFNRSLDDYPVWLKEQQLLASQNGAGDQESPQTTRSSSKKQLRQEQASRRERLKPMYDRVRDIEKNLALNRAEMDSLETKLSDETLYADPTRQAELTGFVQALAEAKSAVEKLEWDWLEASETLEASQ